MYGSMDVWMFGCMEVWKYKCMDVWMYVAYENMKPRQYLPVILYSTYLKYL